MQGTEIGKHRVAIPAYPSVGRRFKSCRTLTMEIFMESLHIEEDIYRQIAEYIEDNALPYIRGWHSEADEFRIADVCFETDSAADGYLKISGKAHDFSRGMKAPQCFF